MWESECSGEDPYIIFICSGDERVHPFDLGVWCTLMLLRLTSVKEPSLFFILCRVSSTFVGLGGSSNTGFIFSPLITSTHKHVQKSGRHIQNPSADIWVVLCCLTVEAFLSRGPVVRLTAGDQGVNAEDGCEHEGSTVSGWAAGGKRPKATQSEV